MLDNVNSQAMLRINTKRKMYLQFICPAPSPRLNFVFSCEITRLTRTGQLWLKQTLEEESRDQRKSSLLMTVYNLLKFHTECIGSVLAEGN